MTALARQHASFALYQGRGPPGTQDVDVGTRVLQAFRASQSVSIPIYDKSAHRGAGDRQETWRHVQGEVDIVLFEGWCLGFQSMPFSELVRRYEQGQAESPRPEYAAHPLEELQLMNRHLATWEQAWHPLIDAFVQLVPVAADLEASPWSLVYPWRLEAEHAMKQRNGGRGMSDEEVHAFVQRYLPTYELFSRTADTSRWKEHCIMLRIGADRQCIDA